MPCLVCFEESASLVCHACDSYRWVPCDRCGVAGASLRIDEQLLCQECVSIDLNEIAERIVTDNQTVLKLFSKPVEAFLILLNRPF